MAVLSPTIKSKAQSGCGTLGGSSTLLTTSVLPFCETIDIEAVVQNLDVPGEGYDLDAYVRISVGTDIEDNVPNIIAALEALDYVGSYPLAFEDTWSSQDGNNFYRRFWFAVSDLAPSNDPAWEELFSFSVEPTTYAVDPSISVKVDYVYQNGSCGTYLLQTISNQRFSVCKKT